MLLTCPVELWKMDGMWCFTSASTKIWLKAVTNWSAQDVATAIDADCLPRVDTTHKQAEISAVADAALTKE